MIPRATKPAARRLYAGSTIVEGKLVTGATGAVTSWTGYGINAIERTSQGLYTFTLEDQYVRLVSWHASQLCGSLQELTFMLKSEDVDNPTKASRTILLWTVTTATATDPTNPSTIFVSFTLQSSSLPLGNTLT